jgi:mannonate dehydratase
MLIHSWRWFGPGDRITLGEIIQTGASNIVTALHDIPPGEVWSIDAIRARKRLIEEAGLKWSVVESVPVHEDIKRRTGHYREYTGNFRKTVIHLGKEGIRTVCYHFMPALDWSRTNLTFRFGNHTESSDFNYIHFAAIDLFILKRTGADSSYPEEIVRKAGDFYGNLDPGEVRRLRDTFLLGFPGSGETFTLEQVMERIEGYRGIDHEQYREHLEAFLEEIIPAAEEAGVKLAIHPDDPPWPLLGMPRVFSTLEDAEYITGIVDSPSNGITFCTGSLGAGHFNDPGIMAARLARRINFAHLRNVTRDEHRNFREEQFFEGDVDMYQVMKVLVREDERRNREEEGYAGIPVRPDHGAQLLGDLKEKNYPGYSLYGRMKSLAEIRGLEIGIRKSLKNA